MSSRQLKKLRAREEKLGFVQKAAWEDGGLESRDGKTSPLEDVEGKEEDEELATLVEVRTRPKSAFAAFAALGTGDDEGDDEDEDLRDGQQQEVVDVQDAEAQGKTSRKKASKKKKNKKKNKAKDQGDGETAGGLGAVAVGSGSKRQAAGNSRETDEQKTELDEIDRALAELLIRQPQAKASGQQAGGNGQLLSSSSVATGAARYRIPIDFKNLKVLNELRDAFGRETIQAASQTGEPAHGAHVEGGIVRLDLETFLRGDTPYQHTAAARGGRGAPATGGHDLVARRNPFIQWKDTWPHATSGGLGMRQLADTERRGGSDGGDDSVEFAFVHNQAYQRLEGEFLRIVFMHDHHLLIHFLKQNPYHISSLIQVSDVAIQDQNASLAADLCERALFSFGRTALSSFRKFLAEGRARLSFQRPENRQFLLAGYHYIKSLIPRGTFRTALTWTKVYLSTMPDDPYGLLLFAQTLAIRAFEAEWLIEMCRSGDDGSPATSSAKGDEATGWTTLEQNPMREYIRQTLVLARLQVEDVAGARTALQQGFVHLPWLYGALFKALNLDVPAVVWGIEARDTTDDLYTRLYVKLCRDAWDTPQAIGLLKDTAAGMAATAKVDVAILPSAEPVTMTIARFVYLDGTPELMALVPGVMLHLHINFSFDPLPPPSMQNIISYNNQLLPWQHVFGMEDEAIVEEHWMDADEHGDDRGDAAVGDQQDRTHGDDAPVQEDQQQSQPQLPRGRMPGAWVEEEDDDDDDDDDDNF